MTADRSMTPSAPRRGGYCLGALAVILACLAMAPAPRAAEPTQAPAPVVIDTRDAPALGPAQAPVTIVEFGDFQCPFCARGAKVLQKLRSVYPDRVRWVFKHLPLSAIHPEAALAHEAAAAAQEQGKFWEMHDLLFENQTRLRYDDLVSYAQELGLDVAAFKQALDTRRYRATVIRDVNEARTQRIVGTPTYFVNGIRVVGARSFADFRLIVEAIAPGVGPATPEARGDAAVPR